MRTTRTNGVFRVLLVSSMVTYMLVLVDPFSVLTMVLSLHIPSLLFCTTFLETRETDLSMCNSDGIGGGPWH